MAIELARVYDLESGNDADDRWRVLVDRLWPRGIRKVDLRLDEWCKDVAPSTALRRWYDHEVDRFAEFERRYRDELDGPKAADALANLRSVVERRDVLLLTATRDIPHSGAHVLLDVLTG